MNKYLVACVLFVTLCLSACAQKKITSKTSSKVPALTYLRMHRTACFGRCPTYSIEIYSNGLVRWNGYMFTDHQGMYEKNVGAKTTVSYLEKFAAYRPDTCSADYPVHIYDIPGINYSVEYNGEEKNIMNANFGPRFMQTFAQTLDEAFKVDGTWIKKADTATISY